MQGEHDIRLWPCFPIAAGMRRSPSTWPALPCGRVRLSEVAAEPANERDGRGGDGAVGGGCLAAAGGCGGVHEAVVVGGSAEVADVLLGDDEGELGMHGWTSYWDVVRAL
jgi:hypothetical protein